MDKQYLQWIEELEQTGDLPDEAMAALLESQDEEVREELSDRARTVRERVYGKDVYLRGLIEFTSYCKNNCYYCGLRAGNRQAERYRLSQEEILDCAQSGYQLGFRTFVLQGGEDPYFTDEKVVSIVLELRSRFPDCAITLSLGERERDSYQAFYDAGANRYLLRHETADEAHYGKLHPDRMSLRHRMQCLWDLKEIGYQVGCGMMVGSPYQETAHLISDLRFMQKFRPEMVGLGPFIPHKDTPFHDRTAGTLYDTLKLLSIVRLMLPNVLLPATTALGTIDPLGREKGILAGANVVMPNLSPVQVRGKYLLYDGKICTGDEAAECVKCMEGRISRVGYRVVVSRGDHVNWN